MTHKTIARLNEIAMEIEFDDGRSNIAIAKELFEIVTKNYSLDVSQNIRIELDHEINSIMESGKDVSLIQLSNYLNIAQRMINDMSTENTRMDVLEALTAKLCTMDHNTPEHRSLSFKLLEMSTDLMSDLQ